MAGAPLLDPGGVYRKLTTLDTALLSAGQPTEFLRNLVGWQYEVNTS